MIFDAGLYLLPSLLIYFVFRSLIANRYLYFFFILGATVAHELSHFLVGLVLNAKPVGFSVIPRRSIENKWTLGSVTFSNTTWYNAFLIGIAPLMLLIPFYLMLPATYSLQDFMYIKPKDFLYWLCLAYVLPSAIPSATDIKVAIAGSAPAVLVVTVILLLKYL